MALRRGRARRPGDPENAVPDVSCHEQALRLLGIRAHFAAELRRKLTSRGYPPEEVTATLARLVAEKYLDDDSAAAQLASAGRERKGWGSARVRAELVRRGAARAAIDVAVAAESVEEETARARELAQRWSAQRTGRAAEPAALVGHLRRKGFSGRAISAALSSRGAEPIELEELDADDEPAGDGD